MPNTRAEVNRYGQNLAPSVSRFSVFPRLSWRGDSGTLRGNMESYEILKEAFESPSTSPKEISSELGVSLSLVYKWAQPATETGSGSRNPLDRVKDLIRLTNHMGIVEWLCQHAGGYFVRNPKGTGSGSYQVVPATHTIVQQFAGLLDAVSRAAQDDAITAEESAEIRVVWDKLKAYSEGFVRCCEEGDFEHIQEALKLSKK